MVSDETEPLQDDNDEENSQEKDNVKYTFAMGKNLKLKKSKIFEDPRIEFRIKRVNGLIILIRGTEEKIGLL